MVWLNYVVEPIGDEFFYEHTKPGMVQDCLDCEPTEGRIYESWEWKLLGNGTMLLLWAIGIGISGIAYVLFVRAINPEVDPYDWD